MVTKQLDNHFEVSEFFDTVIIGGGQAGLSAGYFLSMHHQNFIILDRNKAIGDSWRNRWESLRLFTPSQVDNLAGMAFPHSKNYLPSKDEIADFLLDYAKTYKLPIRSQQFVNKLSKTSDGFEVSTSETIYSTKNVIIASGPYQQPYRPSFANFVDSSIMQLHSSDYLNPTQIPIDAILVVGAGNSGCEIALELAQNGKKVWLAGRDVGVVPAKRRIGRVFDGMLVWWIMTHVLSVNTPIGRKFKRDLGHHGTPLGRITRKEIQEAGIILVPRLAGLDSGLPQLEDGQRISVNCIIWATGFKPDYHWVNLPIFDSDGYPIHSKGVVPSIPGLYFIGLPFQSGLSSSLLGGVGKDAEFITNWIIKRSGK